MADGPLSVLAQRVERLESWTRSSPQGSSPPSSSWVPTALQHHLGRLRRFLPRIQAVLADAEEMEIHEESVQLWLREIKDVWYEADDVLDEYEYELARSSKLDIDAAPHDGAQAAAQDHPLCAGDLVQAGNSIIPPPSAEDASSFSWVQMVSRIEEITERFGEISQQRDRLHLREGVGKRRSQSTAARPPSTPLGLDGPNNIYGREAETRELMSRMFSPGDYNPSVVAVVGMGGVGKTTLVQHVYNDQAVSEHFELRSWVCVSDDFEVVTLTKRIIEAITKERCDLNELSPIQEILVKLLSGKRFLLVLDDMWNLRMDLWFSLRAALLYGLQGSTIVTTTRDERVARLTQTTPSIHVGCLQFDDCWAIFQQFAFPRSGQLVPGNINSQHLDFVDVGKQIVAKCKGLPLACRALGGLLGCESADIDRWNAISRSEIWDLDEDSRNNNNNNILPTLMLSYVHLPTHLKRCFAYCAVFPQDYSFTEAQLVRLWMAQGLIQSHRLWQLEESGGKYFDELRQRSFFERSPEYSPEHEQRFVMHDLIHDLAVSVSGGECSTIKNHQEPSSNYEEGRSLRHIVFVPPGSSRVTKIFQSLCNCGELISGLRSLLIARSPHVWIEREVANEIPDMLLQKYLVSLRALDLGYVGRLQHLPDSIGNLKHLRYLDLSRTRIEVFPESVCQLYLLQTLDLSYARITGLSDSIKYLTQLRYLNLCHSVVRMLPETVGELTNLRTLDLAYTGISKLPESVGNLRHLTFLDLSGTLIGRFPEHVCLLYSLRTLNLNNVAIEVLPDAIGNLQKLHHLNLNETRVETLPESITDLRLLQVLNLSFSLIRKLPKSIGKLGCLSHLDLSSTPLRRIPASICRIHSLQSLLLKGSCIGSLPNQLGRLTRLQHLEFNSECVYAPSGIGRLTNLRTLPALNLGAKPGSCRIQDLRHLTELRGSLQISGLNCVHNPEDADVVDLRSKTQIDRLTLSWEFVRSLKEIRRGWRCNWDNRSYLRSDDESASDGWDADSPEELLPSPTALKVAPATRNSKRRSGFSFDPSKLSRMLVLGKLKPHSGLKELLPSPTALEVTPSTKHSHMVLEKLQPHSGLKVLQVQGYRGCIFPGWMADPSFPRLVELVLQGCAKCSHLPSLGQLPSLKKLSITGASSVKRIGPEFRFGGEEGGSRRRGAFPSLEVMKLQDMHQWVEWRGVRAGDFPRLAWLEISDCPALRGDLPFSSSTCSLPVLRVLKISACRSLKGVSLLNTNVPNLSTAEFKRCEQLVHIDFGNNYHSSSSSSSSPPPSSSSWSWPHQMATPTSTEMELRSLRITGCPRARFFSQDQEGPLLPRTLTYLHIDSECGCLLDWCQGADGSQWLSRIPNTSVQIEKDGSRFVRTS